MKNLFRLFGIIALIAVIGFSIAACDTGDTGEGGEDGSSSDPKTIVITGLSSSYQYGNILLYPVGTSLSDVIDGIGLVAGASHDNDDITAPGGGPLTYPLYKPGNTRWTGSGSYDVYWEYNPVSGNDTELYKASSVSFTSATTTLAFSRFTKISIDSSAYTLDGIWENNEGMRITVSGSTGVYSALGSGASQHQMWHDAVSKGYIAVGKQFWRNITSTGSSTWSGQQLGVTYNPSNPNVATGTGWTDGSLTMSADGQTLTGVFGGGTVTWKRVSSYSLNGVWEHDIGRQITVSESTGVFTRFESPLSSLVQDAINKGYFALNGQAWKNISSTGILTWSVEELGIRYNNSSPNVATGTAWTNMTITMSSDGKTITFSPTGATWTRKQ